MNSLITHQCHQTIPHLIKYSLNLQIYKQTIINLSPYNPSPMRTLTHGKTSYPDMSQRQNPQFKQTAIKYLNQKKQRKQLDKRKHLITNQVKHFEKINSSLQKQLEQKQHQLEWMKQVRERYVTSIQDKKARQQSQKRKLQQLKLYNTTLRQQSIQNINDALTQLHRKKSRAKDELMRNMDQLKRRYSIKKQHQDQKNYSLFLDVKKSRVRCKNRVNKFFQKKSTELTRFYKSMASNQQEKFITSVKQIQQLQTKQSRYKSKIAKKQQRMSKIIQKIDQLKKSSHQIADGVMRSSRYEGVRMMRQNGSKVSRTQRTENATIEQRQSVGFRLANVGSMQFIDGEEVR